MAFPRIDASFAPDDNRTRLGSPPTGHRHWLQRAMYARCLDGDPDHLRSLRKANGSIFQRFVDGSDRHIGDRTSTPVAHSWSASTHEERNADDQFCGQRHNCFSAPPRSSVGITRHKRNGSLFGQNVDSYFRRRSLPERHCPSRQVMVPRRFQQLPGRTLLGRRPLAARNDRTGMSHAFARRAVRPAIKAATGLVTCFLTYSLPSLRHLHRFRRSSE